MSYSCSLAPARPFTSFGTRVCSEQLLQDMTHAIIVPIDYPIIVLRLHTIVTPARIEPVRTSDNRVTLAKIVPHAIIIPIDYPITLCKDHAKRKGVNFLTPSFCFT